MTRATDWDGSLLFSMAWWNPLRLKLLLFPCKRNPKGYRHRNWRKYSNYPKFPHSREKLMGKRVFWKFAKNQVFVGRKLFLARRFINLRFIAYILWGFCRSWEGPFLIRCKRFRTVERASSKLYYFGFVLRDGK